MSKHLHREIAETYANVVDAPVLAPEADRSFNLPTRLYVITAGLYFAFLGIMAAGFSSPGLVIPMAIFVIFLAAFFGIAAYFVRVDPEARAKIKHWTQFRREGVMTATGNLPMKDAVIQMLILPVLIVGWGLTVTCIAALV